MKIKGFGLDTELTGKQLKTFIDNLEHEGEFWFVTRGDTMTIKKVALFSWDFEDVYPEKPIVYIDFDLMEDQAYFEGLTVPESRKEAKAWAKAAGCIFKEITLQGTGNAYSVALLEHSRA